LPYCRTQPNHPQAPDNDTSNSLEHDAPGLDATASGANAESPTVMRTAATNCWRLLRIKREPFPPKNPAVMSFIDIFSNQLIQVVAKLPNDQAQGEQQAFRILNLTNSSRGGVFEQKMVGNSRLD